MWLNAANFSGDHSCFSLFSQVEAIGAPILAINSKIIKISVSFS